VRALVEREQLGKAGRMHRLALILTAMTLACGGDDADPTTTNADTSAGDDSGSTNLTLDSEGSSAATLEDSGDTSGDSGSDTSGAPTSGVDTGSTDGSSGSTTGTPSELEVEISDATAFMNCKPIKPPDPLGVSFTLDFDNQGAAVTSADVTSARLLMGGVEVRTFDLAPSSFGPFDAGETASEPVSKVDGSGMPATGCQNIQCGGEHDIEVVLDVDGGVAIATSTVTVMCGL
jgi:hypothetical protein